MLFYVNVQNKTKYGYDAYDDKGKSIRIGDKVIENKSGLQLVEMRGSLRARPSHMYKDSITLVLAE